MPKFYVNNLEGRAAAIQADLNARYHSGKLTIPDSQDTGMHSGDPHASDGIRLAPDGLHTEDGKHIERLIR